MGADRRECSPGGSETGQQVRPPRHPVRMQQEQGAVAALRHQLAKAQRLVAQRPTDLGYGNGAAAAACCGPHEVAALLYAHLQGLAEAAVQRRQ